MSSINSGSWGPVDLPCDESFEAASRAGRVMHEFLGEQKKPLVFDGDYLKIANALIRSGAIVDEYGYQYFELDELVMLLQISEHWFKYETDGEGNVVTTNKIDWSVWPPNVVEN